MVLLHIYNNNDNNKKKSLFTTILDDPNYAVTNSPTANPSTAPTLEGIGMKRLLTFILLLCLVLFCVFFVLSECELVFFKPLFWFHFFIFAFLSILAPSLNFLYYFCFGLACLCLCLCFRL